MPERSTPETPVLFWRTDLVGERPRNNRPTTDSRARVKLTKEVNRGGQPINQNYAVAAPPRRPDRLEQHRAGETNKSIFRRARFFGTHEREMPEMSTPETPVLF